LTRFPGYTSTASTAPLKRATAAMMQMQDPAGYWWAELESNVTITAEYIMLHRFLGTG